MFSKSFRFYFLMFIVLTSAVLILYSYQDEINTQIQTILSTNDPSVHKITLTDDGFEPREIIISKGDSIIFNTNRNVPFWPASNIHPEHSLYPKFDPRKPLNPQEDWQFQFLDIGRFSFHDHIYANFTGKIIVLDTGEQKTDTPSVDISECSKEIDNQKKQQCWDEQLEQVLKRDGLDSAFEYFIQLYQTEPEVPKECHGWGHLLGKAGYELYKNKVDMSLKPEAAYCGYGYFHGFIGELIKDTGDVAKTKEFCTYVVNELQNKLPSIKENCVHGVGHGVASMLIEEPENWGKLQQVINMGTSICEQIYSDESDLANCYDGVFNESHLDLFNSRYGLSFDEFQKHNDPFWYCKQQEDRHKESCYFEFSGIFWKVFNKDIVAATRFTLENVEDLQLRGKKVIGKIAADRIQDSIIYTDHSDSVAACNIVPKYLYESCFRGILNGFIQHGEPGNLHQRGYLFCGEPSLNDNQSKMCYEYFTEMLSYVYTEEQKKKACIYISKDKFVRACETYL